MGKPATYGQRSQTFYLRLILCSVFVLVLGQYLFSVNLGIPPDTRT